MSEEAKRILTNCDYCGVEIRVVMLIENTSKHHWCDKIKCKLIIALKNNLEWRAYIEPSKWEEARKIIDKIEGEEFK